MQKRISRFWQKTPICPTEIYSIPSSDKSGINFSGSFVVF